MKKFYFLASLAFAFATTLNAQTVINNNYDETSTSIGTQTNNSEKDEMIGTFNLGFWTFKGVNNFGFMDYLLTPNGIGGEFGARANFKTHGNANIDLGINYSFKLWHQEKNKLLLTIAAGPSFRFQDVLKNIDVKVSSTGRISTKEEWKNKFFVDLYINPRITLAVWRINIAAGYYLWAQKFKFSDGYVAHGFNASIGYIF